MSLKEIPSEPQVPSTLQFAGQKQKGFNPGNKIKKAEGSNPLKVICLRLVHFINRGSKFTYDQIDEIIGALQHSILSLQKKKQEMLKEKNGDMRKKRFK